MRAPFMLYNDLTGFMEARNKDGSWAGGTRGWTEGEYYVSILGFIFLTIFVSSCRSGDKWAYSFDVVHAIPELIKRRGGKVGFVKTLEAHFLGGHNEHSNEVNCQK
jgi:putative alpha-1,2-mannosidase